MTDGRLCPARTVALHLASGLLAEADGNRSRQRRGTPLSGFEDQRQLGQADRLERVCAAVLGEPDRHAAVRTFDRLIASLKDQQSPGLVNSGLFASHELRTNVPDRAD